jgi:hypothetical protein
MDHFVTVSRLKDTLLGYGYKIRLRRTKVQLVVTYFDKG